MTLSYSGPQMEHMSVDKLPKEDMMALFKGLFDKFDSIDAKLAELQSKLVSTRKSIEKPKRIKPHGQK